MTSDAYFTGASGTRYAYADLASRIRQEAPHTLGKHIFAQLEAIGLLEEMQRGTTPCALPFTFAEASHTPSPWDCDGCTIMYSAPHETDEITMIQVRANVTEDGWDTVAFIEAIWPGAKANARRIVAAVNACDGISTEALERHVPRKMLAALQMASNYMADNLDEDDETEMRVFRAIGTAIAEAKAAA